jgi:hypothetical protein
MWRKQSHSARVIGDVRGKINVILGYLRKKDKKRGKSKNKLRKKSHRKSGIYEITVGKYTKSVGNLGYTRVNPQDVIRDKRGKTQKAWETSDTCG